MSVCSRAANASTRLLTSTDSREDGDPMRDRDYRPSLSGRVVSWLWAAIFVLIALTIVVDLLKAIWPWLAGVGLVGVVIWWAAWRHFRHW